MKKILIVTALNLEFQAVQKYLTEASPDTHPLTGSTYVIGSYNDGGHSFEVMIVETGAGNNRATDETGRAIQYFKPDFTFFVGVAGGVKDLQIGDVVASTKVIGFEMGKADKDFKPRVDMVPASYRLEQIAKQVKRENTWLNKIGNQFTRTRPLAFVQPIAAGEKVVVSNQSEAYSIISKYCSDAVAIDMEGIGFLIAARPYAIDAIEVRGISDMLENKEEADVKGSQPEAAAHASAFTFAMIDLLEMDIPANQNIRADDFQKQLLDFLATRYPQGPEQEDIWTRAGGDVSILVNMTSRKAQWRNALAKLVLGGGGKKITLETLMNEVKEDFPNDINELFKA